MASVSDVLQNLSEAGVRYLLVGGYASVIHGVPRTTVDLDLALDPDPHNVEKGLEVLRGLGLEPDTDRVDEILGQGGVTCTNDQAVDLLTSLLGSTFEGLWTRRARVDFRGTEIPVVSRRDQIRLLRAAGRISNLASGEVRDCRMISPAL